MKFTDLFIKRPVLAMVVSLVILIAGLQSIRSLSVRQYPRSDIAIVQVTTVYVGANADLVRGFITTPIERVIASADGIDYMESSSAQNVSTITVHLKLNYDANAALTQIQAKVAQVRNDLPPEAQDRLFDNVAALSAPGSRIACEHMDFHSIPADWAEKLTERAQRIGSKINLAELFYTGDRNSAGDYLTEHGWRVDIRTTEQAFSANGFQVPQDELASFGGASGYLSAVLG